MRSAKPWLVRVWTLMSAHSTGGASGLNDFHSDTSPLTPPIQVFESLLVPARHLLLIGAILDAACMLIAEPFVNGPICRLIPLFLRDWWASGCPSDLSRCLFRQRPDSDFRRCGSMDSLAPFPDRLLF